MENIENKQTEVNQTPEIKSEIKSYNGFYRFVSRYTFNLSHIHPTLVDFAKWIAVFWFGKLVASYFTLVPDYYFYNSFVGKTIDNPVAAIVGAILLMVSVEAGKYLGLDAFWKFVLNRDKIVWKIVISALVTVLFVGLSFITSTVGGSMKESNAYDKTPEIVEKYNLLSQNIENDFESQINQLQTDNEALRNNPQGWSRAGGSGSVLTKEQTAIMAGNTDRIMKLKDDKRKAIADLENRKKAELADNSTATQSSASHQFTFVGTINIVQVFLSFLIVYISIRTYYEEHTQKATLATVNNTISLIGNFFDNAFSIIANQKYNQYLSIMQATQQQLELNTQKAIPLPMPTATENVVPNKKGVLTGIQKVFGKNSNRNVVSENEKSVNAVNNGVINAANNAAVNNAVNNGTINDTNNGTTYNKPTFRKIAVPDVLTDSNGKILNRPFAPYLSMETYRNTPKHLIPNCPFCNEPRQLGSQRIFCNDNCKTFFWGAANNDMIFKPNLYNRF